MDRQNDTNFDPQDTTGAELSEQELDQVAGGGDTDPPEWPPKDDKGGEAGGVPAPQPVPIMDPPPVNQ